MPLRVLHRRPNRLCIKAFPRAQHISFLTEKISIAKNRRFALRAPLYTAQALK